MTKTVGDYILGKSIGRGSFACVYKGRHKITNEVVAIKDIYVERTPLKYLEMEISIMKEINHSYIVKLIDCIRTESHVYLIMEYCSMGDLNSYLLNERQQKGMSELDLYHFLEQMASALKYLRQRNFVHRDIKPQNILLVPGKNGRLPDLKISDFGFAKFLGTTDLTNSYCGSPLYMAPEVIARKSYDAKADLWSTGVLLYEMMMGRKLIQTNHMYELQSFLDNYNDQVDFSGAQFHFSNQLKDLISSLLKKNAADRTCCEDFFYHVQLLLCPESDDDEYVVVNTSTSSLDSTSMNRYSTSAPNQRKSLDPNHFSFQEPLPIKRSRKFSVGSASSAFTKALSIASTKIFGSSSSETNSSPPSPLTPMTPLSQQNTVSSILLEDITLDRLLVSCKDTIESERIADMITAIEHIISSNPYDYEQMIVLNQKVKSLLEFGISKLYSYEQERVCSNKLIELNVWMVSKLNDYRDVTHVKADVCVERLLYDKALELSREAAIKQLIHEDINYCIEQYKESILILESIIIDDSQNVIADDQVIIKKLIDSLQSRLNNVLVGIPN
ncbi:kinase-like domain-containing protein [Thamnidium elegans]|nr:kinase-like domain-containing protein [Thamnidium elegans]